MKFDLLNSLALVGIVQGLVFAVVVLASRKYRSGGTFYLGALVFTFACDNFQFYLQDAGILSDAGLFGIWFMPFAFLSAPFLLLYGLSLYKPDRFFRKTDGWLFLPFAIAFIASSILKFTYSGQPADDYFFWLETLLEISALFFDTSVIVYLLIRYRTVAGNRNPVGQSHLLWFRNVLVVLLVFCALWVWVIIEDFYYEVEYWSIVYLGMAAVTYWLGHIGIYKYGVELERKGLRKFSPDQASVRDETTKEKSGMAASVEKIILGQKRYLDPMLTLESLSDELGVSKSHLSRTINQQMGMSFPDYVNALRVEEARQYLGRAEFANYTLVAIGLEAGFASKTTFNTTFKKVTGQTPSEYRKSLFASG